VTIDPTSKFRMSSDFVIVVVAAAVATVAAASKILG
jgi:hypothetical protein